MTMRVFLSIALVGLCCRLQADPMMVNGNVTTGDLESLYDFELRPNQTWAEFKIEDGALAAGPFSVSPSTVWDPLEAEYGLTGTWASSESDLYGFLVIKSNGDSFIYDYRDGFGDMGSWDISSFTKKGVSHLAFHVVVPEPGSLVLMGSGLAIVAIAVRRRSRSRR